MSGLAATAATGAAAAGDLRGLGFGSPSSVAVAVRVSEFGSVTSCMATPAICGGLFPASSTPPLLFSEMTPGFSSHSGCNHPFAWFVWPCDVSVHTIFLVFSQSLGAPTRKMNRCRRG